MLKRKLKVLVIAQDLPFPLNNGGRIDIFYKLKALKKVTSEVYLISSYLREEDLKGFNKIKNDICKKYLPIKKKRKIVNLLHPFVPYVLLAKKPDRNDKRMIKVFVQKYLTDVDCIIIDHMISYYMAKGCKKTFTA